MDTTTIAAPLVSAWNVLADLASCGQDNLLLEDVGRLTSRVVDLLRVHLACPWGLLVLQGVGETTTVAHWGIDDAQQQRLLSRNGNTPLSPNIVTLQLKHQDTPAGTLLLGPPPPREAVLADGFLGALSQQLELLITLQRRARTHRDELAQQQQRARELFVLYENGQVISSSLDVDAMLARITENITLAMDADHCMVHLLDLSDQVTLYEAASYSGDGAPSTDSLRYERNLYPTIAEVLRSADPVAVEDAAFEHNQDTLALLQLFGYRSALILPLKVRDDTLGVLIIGYVEQVQRFSGVDLNLARTLANQIATAVWGTRLADSGQRHVSDLATLQTMSQRFGTELALEDTLTTLFEGAQSLITFAGAQVSLYNPTEQMLHVARWHGVGAGSPSSVGSALSEGLSGWVARYQRVLRLSDMRRSPVRPTFTRLLSGAAVRSYLGVPLMVGEQFVGTLELFGEQPNVFSAVDERLLTIIAGAAARTITNARISGQADEHLRDRLQQLVALQRISRQLTATLSLDRILKFALEEAIQATPATQCYIALRTGTDDDLKIEDAKSGEVRGYIALREGKPDDLFQVIAAAGYEEPANHEILGCTLRDSATIALTALANDEPGVADELSHDDRVAGLGPVAASALALPIFYEDHSIGVINLHSQIERAFDHDAVDFGRALADQVALAIGNAQRYDEQRRQRELLQKRSSLLNEVMNIGEALRTEFSLNEVLEQIAFSIVETIGYGVAIFNLLDPAEPDFVRAVIGAGIPLTELERLRNTPLPVRLVQQWIDPRFRINHSFYVPGDEARAIATSFNVDFDSMTTGDIIDVRLEDGWQSHALLLVPLYSTQAKLIGFLSVDKPYDRQSPTLRSVEPLEILAAQAAIAIENASLLDEARQQADQMRALFRVGTAAVSTLDLDDLLERVYTEIVEYMGDPSFFFVSSYDAPSQALRFELFKEEGQNLAALNKHVSTKAGLSGWVVDHSEMLIVHDLLVERDQIPAPVVPLGKDVRSWVGIPLRSHNQTIGVLSVQHFAPNAFNERHIQFLSSLSNQLAIALDNVRLFDTTRHRVSELSTINQISQTINATLDLDPMLLALHRGIGVVLDTSDSYIALYDAGTNSLVFPIYVVQGVHRDALSAWSLGSAAMSMTKAVIAARQTMVLQTRAEVLAHADPDHVEARVMASWIGVPILQGEQVLGIVCLQHTAPNMYGPDAQRFLETVTSQAATAIANARLFTERERQIEELETFNQIGQELNAVSRLEELSELLYRQTSRLLDTTNFYIALYDDRRGEIFFPLYYEHGVRIVVEPVNASESLTYQVIRTREPLLLQSADTRGLAAERGMHSIVERARSWLGVPMIAADRVIGVICIEDDEHADAYSKDDVRLLTTIASWGATAFENARLLGESRQSVQDLTALNDISVSLAGTLDANEVLHITASSALELLMTHGCMLILLDHNRQPVEQVLVDAYSSDVTRTSPAPSLSTLIATLLGQDGPIVVGDLHDSAAKYDFAAQFGVRGMVAEVIGSRDQPVGVIIATTRDTREWQEREIALLSILANQSGKALESARLFESEQSRRVAADTLRQVAQMLTSLRSLDDILGLILDQLAQVLRYDSASLMLREGDTLHIAAVRGFNLNTSAGQLSFDLHEDQTLARIVRTRRPLVVADARNSPYFVEAEGSEDIRGWIGAPLLLDDEVIGLLTVNSTTVNAYSDEDASLAFALASQAAQAMRNARLFAEVRAAERDLKQRVEERTVELAAANIQLLEEKERLQAVHEITLELTESLDLNEILVKTLALASRAVNARRGSIMLRNTTGDKLICQAVIGGDGVVYTIDNPISFLEGPGLSGWVLDHQQPVCIGDVRIDPRWVYEEGRADEVRSAVAVPLMTQDGALGVLILRSPEIDFFSESQVQLLVTIASEVAIVINNANLFSLVTNIATEKSELLRKQQEETSRSQAILEGLGEGVLVLDEQQRIIMFNLAAEQILDIPASHVLGQPLLNLGSYGASADVQQRSVMVYDGLDQALHEVVAQNKSHSRVIELPSPPQSIVINVGSVRGPNDVLYGRVVVLRDITREIESDRAKRDFISSVSHELRTPLTSIKGYVDLLALGTVGALSEGQASFLSVVKNNTKRLMDLIDDLLEIGRIDSNKIELVLGRVDMLAIIHDVLQAMRAEVERKELTVTVNINTDLPEIEADGRRMTQVVMNMISNAVKYTFAGGSIAVRVFLNPAGLLEVDVQDSGVGISPEQQQHLFRRFYRADNPLRDEAGGTGLGLSIAKSFVELHSGEMWVRSEIGKGSTFSFIVPVKQPEPIAVVAES